MKRIFTLLTATAVASGLSVSAEATTIDILANNPGTWNQWIDTGVDLSPGDLLTITATGSATSTGAIFTGPDGNASLPNQNESLVNSVNVQALVGMIDDPAGGIPTSPTFTTAGMYLLDDGIGGSLVGPGFVGSSFSQIVPTGVNGRLYLGFNDGFDADNSGSYTATIDVAAHVPEPSTLLLAAIALFGLVAYGRRRRA